MIDLAITIDDDVRGRTIIETNNGNQLACPHWPQDSDFRLVAFFPRGKQCEVIIPSQLADDIALAVRALETVPQVGRTRPEWYQRLRKCAAGARQR